MTKRIKVEKSDPPESTIILAEAIVNIGEASRKLLDSGLNERAIITLLAYETKLSRTDIKMVLDGLKRLEGWYCK